jgi:hypothetical protein
MIDTDSGCTPTIDAIAFLTTTTVTVAGRAITRTAVAENAPTTQTTATKTGAPYTNATQTDTRIEAKEFVNRINRTGVSLLSNPHVEKPYFIEPFY